MKFEIKNILDETIFTADITDSGSNPINKGLAVLQAIASGVRSLVGADLRGAYLRGVNLRGAYLEDTYLKDA